jgi:hypothetical protein
MTSEPKPYTETQRRALWCWFTLLAEALNEAGLDQRKVLKPSIAIRWDKDAIHDYLWIPLQKAILHTDSLTKLNKQGDIDAVFDTLNRHLGEKFQLYVPFPSQEEVSWRQQADKIIVK